MSELQDILRVQAKLHKKQGANALGDLFENAGKEIESLSEQLEKANERLSNPQGLQEFVCLEQMKEIPLLEIHRAHQKLHEENKMLNERVRGLKADILSAIGAIEREDDESLYDANCILSSALSQLRKEQTSEYEFREIGETEWTSCEKDWFDYCQKSPEHDARIRKEQE